MIIERYLQKQNRRVLAYFILTGVTKTTDKNLAGLPRFLYREIYCYELTDYLIQ
jgi:regulator of sigma D